MNADDVLERHWDYELPVKPRRIANLLGMKVRKLDMSDMNDHGLSGKVASATFLNLKVLGSTLPDKEAKESGGHPLFSAIIRVLDALKDYMNKKQS